MSATTTTRTAARPAQTLGSAVAAELGRVPRAGGGIGGPITAAALALAVAGAAIAISSAMGASRSEPAMFTVAPVMLAAFVVGVVVTLVAGAAAARDAQSGLVASALPLTPNRGRLFLARWASSVTVTAVTVVVTFVLALLVGVTVAVLVSGGVGQLGQPLGIAALALPATLLLATMAFGLGTIARRPVLAVLAVVGVLVVVPLIATAGIFWLPEALQEPAMVIVEAMPMALFAEALAVGVGPEPGALLPPALVGQLGLLAWAAVSVGIAALTFLRRDV